MKRLMGAILALLLLCGCAGERKAEETVFAMDTVMDLRIWGADAEHAVEEIAALLTELDHTWSATEADGIPAKLNLGDAVLTEAEQAVLHRVETLSARTGGAFDPRLYALTWLWGFPTGEYHVPSEGEIRLAMTESQWDLGAVVKGYAGQAAVEMLEDMDVNRAILNLGGNVQTYGNKPDGTPWQIAIQDPDDSGAYLGVVSVTGTVSVVTSGDYQRYFEQDGVRYHHILDPETGRPAASGLRSVTVICRDGMTADALSTALFVMGLEAGAELWRNSDDFEAVFVRADGAVFATEGAAFSGCEFEVITREE